MAIRIRTVDRTKEKLCPRCSKMRRLSEFTKDRSRRDGLDVYCRFCRRELSSAYRSANLERLKEMDRQYREQHRVKTREYFKRYRKTARGKRAHRASVERYRVSKKGRRCWIRARAKRRAHLDKAECDITEAGMLHLLRENPVCSYCGRELEFEMTHWDHTVPLSRGGQNTLDNLLPVCARCNLSKSDKLLSEWADRWHQQKGDL